MDLMTLHPTMRINTATADSKCFGPAYPSNEFLNRIDKFWHRTHESVITLLMYNGDRSVCPGQANFERTNQRTPLTTTGVNL